jgi:hypothetical protein
MFASWLMWHQPDRRAVVPIEAKCRARREAEIKCDKDGSVPCFLCSPLDPEGTRIETRISAEGGTGPARNTFSQMDRFFLAIMVSGLLLAAVAVSLFVATSGERAVSVMSVPAAPSMPSTTVRPRRVEENRTMPHDDGRR